jgi:hypothetical protein
MTPTIRQSMSVLFTTEQLNKYELDNSKAKVVMGRKILYIEQKIEQLRQKIESLEKDKRKVVIDYQKQKDKNYAKMMGGVLRPVFHT